MTLPFHILSADTVLWTFMWRIWIMYYHNFVILSKYLTWKLQAKMEILHLCVPGRLLTSVYLQNIDIEFDTDGETKSFKVYNDSYRSPPLIVWGGRRTRLGVSVVDDGDDERFLNHCPTYLWQIGENNKKLFWNS